MRINLKLKPQVYTGNSLQNVLSKFPAYGWTFSSIGNYKTDLKGKNIIVYNLIKENSKYKQIRYKNGKYKKSELIRPKKWIAYVYTINVEFAKTIGLKINQYNRNFKYEILN